jgi:ATP-binding cassette, subfamily B, bacterial PglK
LKSLIKNIIKVYSNINFLKSKLITVSIVSVITIFLELLGLGIFIPGIDFLTNQDSIKSLTFFTFELSTISKRDLLLLFLFIVFIIFLIKAMFNIYLSYLQAKLSSEIDEIISLKVYSMIISKSYEDFTKETNATYNSIIINEVEQFSELVKYVITMVVEAFILIGIFSFLIIVQPFSTALIISSSLIYFLLMKFVFKKRLIKWGENRQLYQELIYRDIKNGLSSIVFIKIKKAQNYFLDSFDKNLKARNFFTKRQYAFSQFPRISLELMSIMILCIIVLSNIFIINISFEEITNQLIFFVIAFSRLLPSFNRIFTSYNFINYSEAVINKIYNLIEDDQPRNDLNVFKPIKISFQDNISLKKISYTYPNSAKYVLKDIDLTINHNSIFAIAGKSGSGKSTLINLIMGLINPTEGEISIDKNIINADNTSSYQEMIGFVSQKTTIINSSIKENICFGNSNYNPNDLQKSIKLAELDNFISKQKNKIETIIGEDGATISGGEIQRIGIARALLNKPKILILDEATSALDKNTEELILKTLKKLTAKLTVIIVSHDKGVLSIADKIYYIKQ